MDILIKGMEMPKNCLSCPMKEHCQLFNALHFNERLKMLDVSIRVDGCPLVALPEHGDLKDMADIWDTIHKFFHGDCFEVCKLIRKFCPTIVEATE